MPEAAKRRPFLEGHPIRTYLAASVAGAVHALSFAPQSLPALALLALAGLFLMALRTPTAAAAARLGFFFGLGWFGTGLSWIYISLHHYGDLWAPLAALATGLLAALLALFPAAALAAAAHVAAPARLRRALALIAAWTLAEWLRGVVLGGLPWLSTGYAYADSALAGYAPVLGVYGVGAAAALCAAALAWLVAALPRARARDWAGCALAIVGTAALGAVLGTVSWTRDYGAPVHVRLVQANIAQNVKFSDDGLDEAVARYLPQLRVQDMGDQTAQGPRPATPRPDLIILPESVFPVAIDDLPEQVTQALVDRKSRGGAALIFGAFIVEPPALYFNSAIGLGPDGEAAQRYSKRHLVPFGEYIPLGFHWFVALLHIPIGDQESGQPYQRPMELAGQRIAVNICFEDVFGALIRDAWGDPQREPTMLVNLSNLAWFDDSAAMDQHLQISRMRALETQRPLLRATNTGITAIVGADGAVRAQIAPRTQGVLEGAVQGRSGMTPFLRLGNGPVLALAAALLLGCRFLRRPPARSAAAPAAEPAPPVTEADGAA